MKNLTLKMWSLACCGSIVLFSACSKTSAVKPSTQNQTLPVVVSTFVGGTQGDLDGKGTAAAFYGPTSLATDAQGNIYVTDFDNNQIRKITPEGVVSTFAGGNAYGSANGMGTAASFNLPIAITVDGSDNLYVADMINRQIRKITPDGLVSTLAGSGTDGIADGAGAAASFKVPGYISIDAAGNLYVSDFGRIRKISPAGVVNTIAGTGSANPATADFNNAGATAVDAQGNLFVADPNNYVIRKITPNGVLSTFAGSGTKGSNDGTAQTASFNELLSMTIDAQGNLFVGDSHQIRMISAEGNVITLAGTGESGKTDGPGAMATFLGPSGIVVLGNALYVADAGNNSIRKVTY